MDKFDYERLCDRLLKLRDLACINLDLLYLHAQLEASGEMKAELDKVQALILAVLELESLQIFRQELKSEDAVDGQDFVEDNFCDHCDNKDVLEDQFRAKHLESENGKKDTRDIDCNMETEIKRDVENEISWEGDEKQDKELENSDLEDNKIDLKVLASSQIKESSNDVDSSQNTELKDSQHQPDDNERIYKNNASLWSERICQTLLSNKVKGSQTDEKTVIKGYQFFSKTGKITELERTKTDGLLTCVPPNKKCASDQLSKEEEVSMLQSKKDNQLGGTIICDQCDVEVELGKKWTTHRRRHVELKSGPFICEICSKEFQYRIQLKKHMANMHTKQEPWSCEICGKVLFNKRNKKRHMLLHSSEKPFNCDLCHLGFVQRTTLDEHISSKHTGVYKYHCKLCNRGFRYQYRLLEHYEKHMTGFVGKKRLLKNYNNSGVVNGQCTVVSEIGDSVTEKSLTVNHKSGRIAAGRGPNRQILEKTLIANYNCCICPRQFETDFDASLHILSHEEDGLTQCFVCNKLFPSFMDLKQHVEATYLSYKKWKCSECPEEFLIYSQLNTHRNIFHSKLKNHCEICNKTYSNLASLRTHQKVYHGENRKNSKGQFFETVNYSCCICPRQFKTDVNAALHILSHAEDELTQCFVCRQQFASFKDLKLHVEAAYLYEKKWKCEKCPEEFFLQSQLVTHKSTYHAKLSTKCPICNKIYANVSSLRTHLNDYHSAKAKSDLKCDICNKVFSNANNLGRHKLIHSGVKNYLCNICSKTFSHKYALKAHKWTHSNEKRYKCELCALGFSDKRALMSHINRMH